MTIDATVWKFITEHIDTVIFAIGLFIAWRFVSFASLAKLFKISPQEQKASLQKVREALDKNAPENQKVIEQLDKLQKEIDQKVTK